MAEPIISVSGLRGVIGDSLTPPVAARYACAFAAGIEPGPLVVTRDGRTTGAMLAAAITAALQAVGRDVIDAGVAATPTAGVLVRQQRAAGGIQISASHNPPEYNGLKLFADTGGVISAAVGGEVIARYRRGEPHWVAYDRIGTLLEAGDTTSDHLQLVEAIVDVERIRARGYCVVLDANHGAGSVLGRRLLEHLRCRVHVLGGDPDGRFAHPPEPTAEHLADVLEHVPRTGADVGFCQDPDADRLAVIDETGRYLGEEYTLAMCVDHVLRSRPGPVVANCSTSRMSEDVANKHGTPYFRAAVGEANVVEVMNAQSAVIGGEGNGGVIDPRVGPVRDSFVGIALVLDAMAGRDLPVSRLADELPRYAIEKTKVTFARAKLDAGLVSLERHFSAATADRLDGLRLDWPDGRWLLVRASNTEPIVRIVAEATSADVAAALCRESADVLAAV